MQLTADAPQPRRVLIATVGSGGDVHPYLAIGVELRRRGHAVMMLTNPHFEPRVRHAGLEFLPIGTAEEYRAVVTSPELVHPRRGPAFVIRALVGGTLRPLVRQTRTAIREFKPGVVLRHHICFGVGWVCRQKGVPDAVGVLSPLMWRSDFDSGVFGQGLRGLPWTATVPPAVARFRSALIRLAALREIDAPINAVARELGFPAVRDVFFKEARAGIVNLALWPAALRGPMPDDPPNGAHCGFCPFDQDPAADRGEAELKAFLDAGPPPLVFTLGTSVVHHAGDFYHIAAEVAERLGRRCVLVAGEGAPRHAPTPRLLAVGYAPFSQLLPKAAAVVHHGGIGTTCQCLAAGVPQVVVPFANDEFDTAARCRRLGVAAVVKADSLRPRPLEAGLRQVLDGPAAVAAAQRAALLMTQQNGPATAADELERAAGRPP